MNQPTSQRVMTATAPSQNYGPALAVITTVFFMWGFVTVLNDILVPHLKGIFDLNYTQIMLIQFTFFTAYFLIATPAAKVISWIGYKRTIVTGLAVMGCGAMLFVPAAAVPSYGLFLTALFILAPGMTFLQVAANPYVAVLGPPEKSSSRLNLAQAFNSLGTTIGPYLGGLLILSAKVTSSTDLQAMTPDQLQAHRLLEASSVKLPYVGIAGLLFVLAIAIAFFKLPVLSDIEDPSHHEKVEGDSIWKHRALVLGVIGIFIYVGAEVSIGSFMVPYLSQPDIGNIPARVASGFLTFYWGGAMVGRFVGSALLQKLKTGPVLGTAALIASALVLISILTTGKVAMWSIILVGLFNSVMFPSIFTLAIEGLGRLTGRGSSLLVMAIVGGAVIPEVQAILADRLVGLHAAFLVPAICYLYIVFYGFSGSKQPARAAV